MSWRRPDFYKRILNEQKKPSRKEQKRQQQSVQHASRSNGKTTERQQSTKKKKIKFLLNCFAGGSGGHRKIHVNRIYKMQQQQLTNSGWRLVCLELCATTCKLDILTEKRTDRKWVAKSKNKSPHNNNYNNTNKRIAMLTICPKTKSHATQPSSRPKKCSRLLSSSPKPTLLLF